MVWQYTYLLVFSTLCDKINWYFQVVILGDLNFSMLPHCMSHAIKIIENILVKTS